MRLFSPNEREAIRLADGNTCQGCGVPLTASFHADHVQPYSQGGATVINNAQALCAQCNLTKSDHIIARTLRAALPTVPSEALIAPRTWQKEFVEVVRGAERAVNANVTVGAGKTFAAALAYQSVIAPRFKRPLLIVAAPRVNLLTGWRDSALIKNGLTLQVGVDLDTVASIESGELHGILVTYHFVNGNPDTIAALCDRFDVTVVRDECQWLSTNNGWGDSFAQCTAQAKFHLGMTGTPFRGSGSEKLWGFNYDDSRAVVDYNYDYHRARADGVSPELSWQSFGGLISWQRAKANQAPTSESSRFGENEAKSNTGEYVELTKINRRLRFGCYASQQIFSGYLRKMLNRADAELQSIRKTHKHAGGIIFAQSQKAAKRIAEYLRERGRSCEVVTSDDTGAALALESFATSDCEWLVSVDMLKEGTDIPRLRVAVLACAVTTARQIVQMVGRLLRLDCLLECDEQPVMVFMPKDPRLVEIMENFGREVIVKIDGNGGGGGGGSDTDATVLISVGADDVEIELTGTVGQAMRRGDANNIATIEPLFTQAGFGVGFDDVTMAQGRALAEVVHTVAGMKEWAGHNVVQYVNARNVVASALTARTGFNRRACKTLVDLLALKLVKGLRLSGLKLGEDVPVVF